MNMPLMSPVFESVSNPKNKMLYVGAYLPSDPYFLTDDLASNKMSSPRETAHTQHAYSKEDQNHHPWTEKFVRTTQHLPLSWSP